MNSFDQLRDDARSFLEKLDVKVTGQLANDRRTYDDACGRKMPSINIRLLNIIDGTQLAGRKTI